MKNSFALGWADWRKREERLLGYEKLKTFDAWEVVLALAFAIEEAYLTTHEAELHRVASS